MLRFYQSVSATIFIDTLDKFILPLSNGKLLVQLYFIDLHMHKTGVRMTNEVIRNGKVIHTSLVDVFEFDQQGTFHVQQESYEVRPGDSFRTSCYYRDGSKFGLGSDDEMCIAYILYYPARKDEVTGFPWICAYGLFGPDCIQDVVDTDLKTESELDRQFGTEGSDCIEEPSSSTSSPTVTPIDSPITPLPTKFPSEEPTTPSPTNSTWVIDPADATQEYCKSQVDKNACELTGLACEWDQRFSGTCYLMGTKPDPDTCVKNNRPCPEAPNQCCSGVCNEVLGRCN